MQEERQEGHAGCVIKLEGQGYPLALVAGGTPKRKSIED
jgi:hypothetical protein